MRFPWWNDVSNHHELVEPEVARNAIVYRGDAVALPSEAAIGLDQAAITVCKAADTMVEALRGRSRSTELAAARKAFAVFAVQYTGHAVADVARSLQKHPSPVSRWLETPTATAEKPRLVKHILELAAADLDVLQPRCEVVISGTLEAEVQWCHPSHGPILSRITDQESQHRARGALPLLRAGDDQRCLNNA